VAGGPEAAGSEAAAGSEVAGGPEVAGGSGAGGVSAVAGGFGVAGLLPARPPSPAELKHREYEVVVRGFGPGGAALAERMAGRAAAWRASGRPRASGLRVSAYPRESPGQDVLTLSARPGQVILDRPHTRFLLAWPSA
jgi:protein-L-isoaspartate(D-aspartate) O-methyltransferase